MPHKVIELRLCPRQFGHPNHRQRSWRIVYNKRKKSWASPYSLQELADLLLAPQKCELKLDWGAYLVASDQEVRGSQVREMELSRYRVSNMLKQCQASKELRVP